MVKALLFVEPNIQVDQAHETALTALTAIMTIMIITILTTMTMMMITMAPMNQISQMEISPTVHFQVIMIIMIMELKRQRHSKWSGSTLVIGRMVLGVAKALLRNTMMMVFALKNILHYYLLLIRDDL